MKKFILLLLIIVEVVNLSAQDCCWVFFTDKHDCSFAPYDYFDSKAIERRQRQGIPLFDSTDFPVNESYAAAVSAFSEELIGTSRWLNAVAVNTFHIDEIKRLPFVRAVSLIESSFTPASVSESLDSTEWMNISETKLFPQLQRMQGEQFVKNGLDGKGVRIAVLDGGFRLADKHSAFQHLRDNQQIIATYNFPLKQVDVYGWDSHGTMVLSCIAGMNGDTKIGLATGAEFLLARTEVALEPRKEEVWWMMGMEWADRNGADIINSSLGYGKDRYNPEDMDGTSLVARAANIAASKGILVCNSMGNEGDDRTWLTVITPADADSVLSVGGINEDDTPCSFTSVGPTADGRLKPNVSAYGHAFVANPSGADRYTYAYGTSFSSPLVAGFAACAWQSHRQWTNMQLKSELEHSGDLYPHYNYVRGFGVPQASYFVQNQSITLKDTSFLTTPGDSSGTALQMVATKWGVNAKYNLVPYLSWGFVFPSNLNNTFLVNYGKSESIVFGLRFKGNICKWYSLGVAAEIGATWYNLKEPRPDGNEADLLRYFNTLKKENVRVSFLIGEFYQRFRCVPGGLFGYGFYVDMGVFAGWNFAARHKTVSDNSDFPITVLTPAKAINPFQWGVRGRIGFDIVSIFVQYRISRLDVDKTEVGTYWNRELPDWEAGLQLVLPIGK